jgi:hypothetical protein
VLIVVQGLESRYWDDRRCVSWFLGLWIPVRPTRTISSRPSLYLWNLQAAHRYVFVCMKCIDCSVMELVG